MVKMLLDPVSWGEQMLRNRDGKPRKFWKHQQDDLRCSDRFIIHRDGRKVGKSVCIVTDILHFAFTTKGGRGLVAAPHQGHLDTLIEELEFQIGESAILRESVGVKSSGHEAVRRKPYFEIRFTSGAMIYFRPAGIREKPFVRCMWTEYGWMRRPGCRNRPGMH